MKNLVDLDLWFSNISVYQNHLDDLVDKNVAFLFSWGQGHNHILVTYGILWKCQVLTTALPENSPKMVILKTKEKINVGVNMEKLEPSCTAGGDLKL